MTTAACFCRMRLMASRNNLIFRRYYSENAKNVQNGKSRNDEKEKNVYSKFRNPDNEEDKVRGLPEPPTTCCMAGCPNCVWLEYAEKLTEYFRDGGEKALNLIDKLITDPNMKAYLMHELRMRNMKR